MAFGKKVASDVRESSGDWIRRFQDGETQIRICPMTGENQRGEVVVGTLAWPQEKEHFDEASKIAFPCTGDSDCIGCNSGDKKVRDRSAKIYMIALDEEGDARIFKIGRKLYKSFKAKEQRLLSKDGSSSQPLSDRDYLVVRSGSGFDTEYEAEAGEVYEMDFPDVEEYPSISDALLEAYNDAADIYGEEGIEVEEEEPRPARKASRKAAAKKAPSRKKAAAKAEPEDEDEEEVEEEEPKPVKKAAKRAPAKKAETEPEEEDEGDFQLGDEPTEAELELATTEDLKAWLTENDIEFPPRAPRRRLIGFVNEALQG